MKMLTALLLATTIATTATAQPAPPTAPSEYTLRLSPNDVNVIGAAINELTVTLTQRLVRQIEAQNEAFRKANEPKPAAPAGNPEPPK